MAKSSDSLALVPRRAAPDPTLPVILEFQWPSTAVANAPMPRSARGITYIVASLLGAMIALMALIPVDQVVTSTGIVVARAPTLVVQPLDTSIVRTIAVHEGQHVHKGDVLATLDPTIASADLGALTARVSSLGAEVARWQAEAAGQPFAYSGRNPDLALQAALYAQRKAEFDLKIENYREKIDEAKAVMTRSLSDAQGYRDRLDVAKDIAAMRSTLEKVQAGSHLNTLIAIDNRAEMARSLANAQQTAEAAKRDLAAMTAERDGFVQSWRADVSQHLSDSSRLLSDAQEDLKKAKLHKQLVELTAEQDSVVLTIAKVSPGTVMQSGQQLITLVPEKAPLEVEANVSGRDSGFVKVGDDVTVKFDTFPFAQYGMAQGQIRMMAPGSLNSQDEARNPTTAVPLPTTSTDPFYVARVTLDKVDLHNVPSDFHVLPGMPVSADIKVGKRTVLTYLLSRVLSVAEEGMREPW